MRLRTKIGLGFLCCLSVLALSLLNKYVPTHNYDMSPELFAYLGNNPSCSKVLSAWWNPAGNNYLEGVIAQNGVKIPTHTEKMQNPDYRNLIQHAHYTDRENYQEYFQQIAQLRAQICYGTR